ncbi:DUF427 domain-containing protein [Arthrobacter sp. H5]|uniref:DUF427 domain-containing protein n=1 Tax=Arthrobacter sp. H5 TaxID=1267973 RepID=UPI0004834BC1|nr:DUF427 domain-containing protein [Arthrobacter sp. H5]
MAVQPQKPGPAQESVWDYPRPPRLERSDERVVIEFGGRTIAESTSTSRVLETSHPPVYYVPTADFEPGVLIRVDGTSWCEFKGEAHYYDVVSGTFRAERAGWGYLSPTAGFEALLDTVAVYPGLMGRCLVDGETVQPQAGGFYGGWITSRVVGPFKGEPGSWGW